MISTDSEDLSNELNMRYDAILAAARYFNVYAYIYRFFFNIST